MLRSVCVVVTDVVQGRECGVEPSKRTFRAVSATYLSLPSFLPSFLPSSVLIQIYVPSFSDRWAGGLLEGLGCSVA